jgi:hypothetical protein
MITDRTDVDEQACIFRRARGIVTVGRGSIAGILLFFICDTVAGGAEHPAASSAPAKMSTMITIPENRFMKVPRSENPDKNEVISDKYFLKYFLLHLIPPATPAGRPRGGSTAMFPDLNSAFYFFH